MPQALAWGLAPGLEAGLWPRVWPVATQPRPSGQAGGLCLLVAGLRGSLQCPRGPGLRPVASGACLAAPWLPPAPGLAPAQPYGGQACGLCLPWAGLGAAEAATAAQASGLWQLGPAVAALAMPCRC